MKKKLSFVFIPILFVILISIFYYLSDRISFAKAGLLIDSEPASTVLINGEQIGKTPLDTTLNTSEVNIRLVPDSFDTPLATYETNLELTPGVKSVVIRDFGQNDETSSGVILSFDKASDKNASIAVVTYPESAQVLVNGSSKGFSPYKLSDAEEKEYSIKTTIPGYFDKEIKVNAKNGYLLTASFDLAKDLNFQAQLPEITEEEEEEKEGEPQTASIIKILPTPLGFLRVREDPVDGTEIARVDSGDEYSYLEIDDESGWYKIEYEEDLTGWVSDEYVEDAPET